MANPYEIFTRVTLENKASAVLATLAKDVLNVEGGVNKLAKAFEQAGTAAKVMAAGLMGAAGIGIIATLYKTATAAAELSHQLSQIREQGVGLQQMGGIKAAIMGVHGQVPGIASDDAAKIFGQIRSLVGDEDAKKLLVPLSKFAQLFGNVSGKPGGGIENIRSLVRAADMIGKLTDPTTHQVDLNRLQGFLDLASKATIATHGVVGPQTWLALAQQGAPAMSRMSDQGLMTMAMLSQEMGGFRSGTALSSLFSQFQGGIMTKWRAQKFMELGLLDKNAIQEITHGGHIVWRKGHEPGTSPFAMTMAEDPLKAVDMLRGAMATHGYPTIEKQVPLLFELLQRQTSIREVHALLRNTEQMKSERGRMFGAMGLGEALDYMNKHDLSQAMTNFGKSFHDMMVKIGDALTPGTIKSLNAISSIFNEIGKIASAHPGIVQAVAAGFAALAITLGGAAAVALAAAIGPTGWLVAGIAAVVASLGTLIAIKWEELKVGLSAAAKAFETIVAAAAKFGSSLLEIGKKIWDYVSTLGGLLNKTSFTGGGFGGGTGGMAAIENAAYSKGEVADYIRQSAISHGIDPNVALAVFKQESGLNPNAVGDGGRSFGVAQLYTGGGEGNRFRRMGGSLSPGAWRSQVDYALGRVAEGGWTSWHGARDIGIGQWQGVHPNHSRIGTVRPYRGGSSSGGDITASVYLDGKMIASNAVRHIMRSVAHATQAPHFDGRGLYVGPDAQLNTA